VHSNAFSLVRRVAEVSGLTWSAAAPFDPAQSLGQTLMTPTRVYVRALLALHRIGLLKAAAHITGGGLPGNLPRVLPPDTEAVLEPCWPIPPVFGWLARAGGVAPEEMLRAFNCGIGMALVVADGDVDTATTLLREHGESVTRIGHIAAGSGPARMRIRLPAGWPA
jgi:phosphoribosylformylglycinamidine cyclo-ligase